MYFGLMRISQYPFVPVGTAVVFLWSLLLGMVFVVGAVKGAMAALRYYRRVGWSGAGALVATWLWALLSGQWQRFVGEFGWIPLLEMLFGAALLLFVMVFMGMTYVSTKLRDEHLDPEDAPEDAGNGSDEADAEGAR